MNPEFHAADIWLILKLALAVFLGLLGHTIFQWTYRQFKKFLRWIISS